MFNVIGPREFSSSAARASPVCAFKEAVRFVGAERYGITNHADHFGKGTREIHTTQSMQLMLPGRDKNTISARTERAFWEDGYQLLDRSG
jgi:hypothetical protein